MYEHNMYEPESAKTGDGVRIQETQKHQRLLSINDVHASSFLGRVQAGDSRGVHKIARRFPIVKNQFCITVKSRLSSAECETLKIC